MFEFQQDRSWNDIVGAPKLRASAALFLLGPKGSYFAAESGGKVTANGRVHQFRWSQLDLSTRPAALLFVDPLIGKCHWRPAIATPFLVQATETRKQHMW